VAALDRSEAADAFIGEVTDESSQGGVGGHDGGGSQ
jgi:hypothetical protein